MPQIATPDSPGNSPESPTPTSMRTLGPFLLGCLALVGCAERAWMLIPAKVGLQEFPRIGLVDFVAEQPELGSRATRTFQQQVLDARPEVALVELGAVSTDWSTLGGLAEQHGLDAVFVGSLEFSGLAPSIGIASSLVEVQARAELRGTLTVRLLEPASGATAWVRTCDRTATVAHGGLDTSGNGSASYADVEAIRANMVGALAHDATWAFRDHYERKKLKHIPPHYEVTYPDGVAVYAPPAAE